MNRELPPDQPDEEMTSGIISMLPAHVQEAVRQSLEDARSSVAGQYAAVDITSFYLGDEDQRREFLWQYYAQGETVLFAAVNHIWNSLEGDREWHCALVGTLSGTGGSGKAALVATLQQFLGECLAFNAELPRFDHYPDVETWHRACVRSWEDDATHARALCARYSTILNGKKSLV